VSSPARAVATVEEPPLDDMWRLVEWRARRTPDRPFLSDDHGRELTFGAFADAAERVAAGLADLGVAAGTRVMWQLPTTLEAAVLSAALARLGAVQNPVIPLFREAELRALHTQFAPQLVVTTTSWRGFDHAEAIRAIVGPDVPVVVSDHLEAGRGLALPQRSPVDLPPVVPSRGLRWVYTTSGSTGVPKGVKHSDASVIATAATMVVMPVEPTDRFAVPFPYAHIGGAMWVAMCLQVGSRLILFDTFDPVESPLRMSAHGVTLLGSATPFFLAYLAAQRAHPERRLFPKLRAVLGGGAGTPEHLDQVLRRELGGRGLANGYGLTECPAVGYPDLDDEEGRRLSMWRPGPGVHVRVVSADGTECKVGEEGELRLAGPQQFLGYLDPAMDSEAIDERGYVRTGDLAVIDERGRVRITGRLKEIIVRNGENISMAEVEGVLASHSALADVAVIAVPDPRAGERCCAVLALADGAVGPTLGELAEHCRAAGLARHKSPEQIAFVEAIPRNAMGKVRRAELRASVLDG